MRSNRPTRLGHWVLGRPSNRRTKDESMWKPVLIVVATAFLSPGLAHGEPPPLTPGERAGQIDDLNRRAFQAFRNRDFVAAEASAQQAWDLSRANASIGAGVAATSVAAVLTMHGRFEEALDLQDLAEAHLRTVGG